MAKIDLHIHSCYSDGSEDIPTLVKKIADAGLKIFSLTDHDSVAGCDEIKNLISHDIKFIPGVELTCQSDNLECHILGYYCDYNNESLLKLIEKGKILRKKKLDTRIDYLKKVHNIILTPEESNWLYSRTSVVKTHIANILVKRGLASDNVEAMKNFLNNCKCPNTKFTVREAIDTILESGGIPIWAHPLGGEGEVHIEKSEFLLKLKMMLEYGIRGLECYYSRYNEKESNFLVFCANSYELKITGGSDYHGTNKTIPLGRLNSSDKYIDSSLLSL